MQTQSNSSNWNETKSQIKARFGKLTDESIESSKDDLDSLSGKLQSAYGYAKEQADREVKSFRASMAPEAATSKAPVAETKAEPKAEHAPKVTPISEATKVA